MYWLPGGGISRTREWNRHQVCIRGTRFGKFPKPCAPSEPATPSIPAPHARLSWPGRAPGLGAEFLHSAAEDFGYVQVSVLIDSHRMRSVELTGQTAAQSPAIQEIPVQIVFDEHGSSGRPRSTNVDPR